MFLLWYNHHLWYKFELSWVCNWNMGWYFSVLPYYRMVTLLYARDNTYVWVWCGVALKPPACLMQFLRALVDGVECSAVAQTNAEHLSVLLAPKRCRTVRAYGAPFPVKTHLHETGVNVGCKIQQSGGTIWVARLSYEEAFRKETVICLMMLLVLASTGLPSFEGTRIPCTSSTRSAACIIAYCNLGTASWAGKGYTAKNIVLYQYLDRLYHIWVMA